jgi:hypothetical protein
MFPDVEDGEARILAVVTIGVEAAYHGADVRLEKTVAYNDDGHAPEQQHLTATHDHELADRHQHTSQ